MRVEFLSELVTQYHASPNSGRRWTVRQPFRVLVDDAEILVPPLFWTDFASVPSVVWPLLDPYDLGRAPVLHDFLYFAGWRDRNVCDDAFLAGMEADGISAWRRWAAYAAVRGFGGVVWSRYRRDNQKYQLARIGYGYRLDRWKEPDGRPAQTIID